MRITAIKTFPISAGGWSFLFVKVETEIGEMIQEAEE